MAQITKIKEKFHASKAPGQESKGLLSNVDPLSPLGITLWSAAFLFDLSGLLDLIPGVGNVISIFVSAFAAIIMGALVYIASGHITINIRLKRIAKKSSLRMLVGFAPFLAAIPLWTLWMWKEMVRKK